MNKDDKLKQNIAELSEQKKNAPKNQFDVFDYESFLKQIADDKALTGGGAASVEQRAKNRASKFDKRKMRRRIVVTTACFLITLMLIVYLMALAMLNMGGFTVKTETDNPDWKLTLSTDSGFENKTQQVTSTPVEKLGNTSFVFMQNNTDDIKALQDKKTQSEEDQYMLCTFFVRNDSKTPVGYRWEIKITQDEKGLGKAIRVMVIKNAAEATDDSFYTVYAYPNADGSPVKLYEEDDSLGIGADAPLTIPFLDSLTVARYSQNEIGKSGVDTYTVLLWIEGTDPDCVSELMGGSVALVMNLEVLTEITE